MKAEKVVRRLHINLNMKMIVENILAETYLQNIIKDWNKGPEEAAIGGMTVLFKVVCVQQLLNLIDLDNNGIRSDRLLYLKEGKITRIEVKTSVNNTEVLRMRARYYMLSIDSEMILKL